MIGLFNIYIFFIRGENFTVWLHFYGELSKKSKSKKISLMFYCILSPLNFPYCSIKDIDNHAPDILLRS